MKYLWIVDWGVENPVITETKEQARKVVETWAKEYEANINWFEKTSDPNVSENFHAIFYGLCKDYDNERNGVGCISMTEFLEDSECLNKEE